MNTTRLTDYDFFTRCLDTSIPELSVLPALAEAGDFSEAQRIFAGYARAALKPEKYLAGKRESLEEDREQVIRLAEDAMAHKFVSCRVPYTFGKEIDWEYNPTYNGYEEWPWQLNRHPEWKHLARGYLLTGDEKYAAEWARQLTGWAVQAQVPENASGYATICWRTIEAGIRMSGSWPYSVHAFVRSPSVSDEVITILFKCIWEHGWRLRNFNTKNNWLIMEMHGLARLGLLYPFLKEASDWLNYAHMRLKAELDIQIYPDGMQNELSLGYHYTVVHNYTGVLDVYRQIGVSAPDYLENGLEALYAHYLRACSPCLYCPTMNDGGHSDARKLLAEGYRLYPHREDFRYIATGRREGEKPAFLSVFHEYGGAAMLRDGWEEKDFWAYMDLSPFGTAHQHEDKLNVQIAAFGHEMLTEAGQFDYDTSEMRKYVLSTRGHNTARIDGMDQNRRAKYRWDPTDIAVKCDAYHSFTDARDTLEAVYDEGYGPDFLAVKHTRRFLFLKKEEGLPRMFAAIDRFEAADGEQHSYELMWHLTDQPTTVREGGVVNTFPDGTGIGVFASTSGTAVIRGQKTPVFQGWLPRYGVGDVEHYPIPTVINTGLFTGSCRVVTVLCPFEGNVPAVKSVEASADVSERPFTVHLTDGTSVVVKE